MEYGINRNASGYVDPTAYTAIKNIISEVNKMEIYRGDIFRVKTTNGNEKEIVVLSVHDRYCTVLMLSDNDKLPFAITCNGVKHTDPGQLQYVYNDNLTNYIRSMTKPDFTGLMQAVIDSLGYNAPTNAAAEQNNEVSFIPPVADDTLWDNETLEELIKTRAERDVYKQLCEKFISDITAK